MKKYIIIVFLLGISMLGFVFLEDPLGKLVAQLSDTRIPFAPYNLKHDVADYNQITISWTDDSANSGSDIDVTEFRLSRRLAYTGNWNTIAVLGYISSYIDANLSPGGYEYRVNACNANGCSNNSSPLLVTINEDTTPPTMPDNFSLPQKEVTDTKANLYWTASTDDIGVRQYDIYRSIASTNNFSFIASVSAFTFQYTDSSLSPIANYYYYIEAKDFAGNKSLATTILNIVTTSLENTPGYVRIVSPNGGECFYLPGNLTVQWTGTGVNQAKVYYNSDLIFTGRDTIVNWYMTASVSPTIAGTVKVVSLDDNGNEINSDESDNPFIISTNCNQESPNIKNNKPNKPTFFKASLDSGTSNIRLTWQDNSTDETEFRIFRRSLLTDAKWILIGKVGSNITTFIDSNVPAGDYEYDSNACNTVGCSDYSNQYKITAIVGTGVNPDKVYTISDLKDGDIVGATGSDDPDIYIVNNSGYKRLFLNPIIFQFYGHLGGFDNVKKIDSIARDTYKTSGLFRNCEINDGKVYGVEITGEDTATLHWINTTGEQAVIDDPDFFKKVFCINTNEFNWYQKGLDYTSISQIPEYTRP